MTRTARRFLLVGIAVVAAGGATAAAIGVGGADRGEQRRSAGAPKTVEAVLMTLVDYEDAAGTLGFGAERTLRYTPPTAGGADVAAGAASPGQAGQAAADPKKASAKDTPPADDEQNLVTWLPAAGATVTRGRPVLRVDNHPVVLLYGQLPVYRSLRAGSSGPDVEQLERNLTALGYDLSVDEEYTDVTALAVKQWQHTLGVPETGVIAPGQLLYGAGAVRIASHTVEVGAPATGDILTYTGTSRQVLVEMPVEQRNYAAVGTAVTVTLPDGKAAPAKVGSVGAPKDTPDGRQTVAVVVRFASQKALGNQREGPVVVRFVAEERKDVLAVPVVALVALAEGGYGVQLAEGSSLRYIAVETGLFAAGKVEITGGELRPGMHVVVPL